MTVLIDILMQNVTMELVIAKVVFKLKKKKAKPIKPDTIWPHVSIYNFKVILQNTYILHNRLLAAFLDRISFNLSWHAIT